MNNTEKSVTRCKKQYCPKFTRRQKKLIEKATRKLTKKLEGDFKNKGAKKLMKYLSKTMGKGKEMDKRLLEGCIKGYCNPSCKNTIFEDGTKFPKSIEDELKKEKHGNIVLEIIKKTRKNIFGNKKSVLEDNFYKALPKEKVNKIKKEGAISGCSVAIL